MAAELNRRLEVCTPEHRARVREGAACVRVCHLNLIAPLRLVGRGRGKPLLEVRGSRTRLPGERPFKDLERRLESFSDELAAVSDKACEAGKPTCALDAVDAFDAVDAIETKAAVLGLTAKGYEKANASGAAKAREMPVWAELYDLHYGDGAAKAALEQLEQRRARIEAQSKARAGRKARTP
jgi:hypothetical protein